MFGELYAIHSSGDPSQNDGTIHSSEDSTMSRFLVIGASGTVGSELATLLQAAGHEVRRATSRTPTAPDQVQVDLVGGQGLAQALAGTDGAFVLAPPGHARQDLLLNPVVDQARAQGLKKLVLMTAMGADADDSAPLRQAELHLERSGLAWNVIRPNWFMQNFHTFWLQGILSQGKILLPTGQAKGSFIDARDISAVAAQLLTRHDVDNRAFDLTGSQALDHDEVAAILTRATGRTITYQDIPPQALLEGLLQAGLPADYAGFLVTILGFFKAGYSERTTDAVQTLTGRAPRRLEQYAQEHRSAWVG